jgi:virulence-associated protein VagC
LLLYVFTISALQVVFWFEKQEGVRIPKTIIEQAQLGGNELEFKVLADGLLIRPVNNPRQGWEQQFRRGAEKDGGCEPEWLEVPLVEDDEWECPRGPEPAP